MGSPVIKIIFLSLLAAMLAIPSIAQNTKGDKPTPSRETRFSKTTKERPAKRIKSKRRTTTSLRAYKPRKKSKGGERAGRPLGPIHRSRPSERPRQFYSQKSIYVNNKTKRPKDADRNRGSRFKQRNVTPRSASGRVRNVYPQSSPYVNYSSKRTRKPPRPRKVVPRSASKPFVARKSIHSWAQFPKARQKRERPYKGDIAGRRVRTRNFETKKPPIVNSPGGTAISRSSGFRRGNPKSKRISVTPARRSRNVYSQNNRYVNNYLRHPRKIKTTSNVRTLAKLNRLQASYDRKPGRKRKVVPRSASRAFIARRSTNMWARFPRPKKKGERAVTTDIAGRPLRTKNFETQRPRVQVNPTARPYKPGKHKGDRPYRGPAAGGHVSATRTGRGWRGDITNRRIRKNFTSKRRIEGKPILSPQKRKLGMRNQGEGYAGNIRFGRRGFENQGEEFTGTFKRKRLLKGGGSVSGKRWNNKGQPLPVRTPGLGRDAGKYQGDIRFGGKAFRDQGEEFAGNVKTKRPPKGGGSVSGRRWNNKGQPVPVRTPGLGRDAGRYQGDIRYGRKVFSDQGEEFSGNIKTRRPAKGGGSVSGKLWNNRRTPIAVRTPSAGAARAGRYSGNIKYGQKTFADQGEEFSGNIKTRRPKKGGGSVSGKLWNNKETAIAVRTPSSAAAKAGQYSGNIRYRKKTYRDQGEEFTGNIKAKKPVKGGGSISGKLWNNKETPIEGRTPKSNQGEESVGRMRWRAVYVKNPKAADEAIHVKKLKTTFDADGLQIKVKRPEYVRRRNAPEGSLPSLKPGKASMKAGDYVSGVKSYRYVKNPSSADGALRVRNTGQAFARAADYQGDIKMRKFDLFGRKGLHPDAQFMKINKNNVAEERDAVTNLKLFWARLFKKNETQPDHLKDKRGKPRYDKGEAGLWYD